MSTAGAPSRRDQRQSFRQAQFHQLLAFRPILTLDASDRHAAGAEQAYVRIRRRSAGRVQQHQGRMRAGLGQQSCHFIRRRLLRLEARGKAQAPAGN